jgi:hypothetical protein
MFKRNLPLALLLAWAPAALAFPPCPLEPVELGPLDGPIAPASASATPLWFKAGYTLVGHPDMIRLISLVLQGPRQPGTGLCDGTLPIPEGHTSTGLLQLSPAYAPKGGFGIVVLPWMPAVAGHGLRLQYTLSFQIADTSPAQRGDWLDVVQLDFNRSAQTGPLSAKSASAIYRVRKIQRNREGPATLEVIESRMSSNTNASNSGQDTALPDRVVAVIPLQSAHGATPIALRWTQAENGFLGAGSDIYRNIDSVFEVVGPSGTVLYSVALPEQWANTFSMGLLDYNVPGDSARPGNAAVEFSEMLLSASTLPAFPD